MTHEPASRPTGRLPGLAPARPRFSARDAARAADAWGMNCGPGAVAAMARLSLDAVRPHLGDFERKGFTNPSLMWRILDSVGVAWHPVRPPAGWPAYGLARVQWEGPWTAEGVPVRARYRHTHWVGAATRPSGEVAVFDINAIGNGSGWTTLRAWREILVPWILEACEPGASGLWHLTHVVEITALPQRAEAAE